MERESVPGAAWVFRLAQQVEKSFPRAQVELKLDGPPPTDEELLAVTKDMYCGHMANQLVHAVAQLRAQRYKALALWLLRKMRTDLFFRGIDFDDSLFWSDSLKIVDWPTHVTNAPVLELIDQLGILAKGIKTLQTEQFFRDCSCLRQFKTVVRCQVKPDEHYRLKWLAQETPPEHLFESAFEALCYASWYLRDCDVVASRSVFVFGYPGGWLVVRPDTESRTAHSQLWIPQKEDEFIQSVMSEHRTWYVFFPGLPEEEATS